MEAILRMTEYIIKKPPVTTKRAAVKLRSNHAEHCTPATGMYL